VTVLLVGIGDFGTGFQSGRPRALHRAIRDAHDVVTVSLPRAAGARRAIGAADARMPVGNYLAERSRHLTLSYALELERAIEQHHPDAVVSTTTLPFTRPTTVPSASWPDAPLNMMISDLAYPRLTRLSKRAKQRYIDAETQSLSNQSLIVMPTKRALEYVSMLGVTNKPNLFAPFGPNIDPALLSVARAFRSEDLRSRPSVRPIQLLFIGLDWSRKGGPIALETVAELNRRGLSSRLTVIGVCPREVAANPLVNYLGRLNPDSPKDQPKLVDALSAAWALIFPTRADNYGAVACEAASVGVPVLISTSAGVSEHVVSMGFGSAIEVQHDVKTEASLYANAVEELAAAPSTYSAACEAGPDATSGPLSYRSGWEAILRALLSSA